MSSASPTAVLLCLLVLVGLGLPADGAAQGVTVDHLSAATFSRVPGPEAGGAVLDVGASGTWMDQAVTTPTVIFDGRVYLMWFTGVEKDRPGESAYLYRTSIGAAVSLDGITWALLNDGEPVFTPGPHLAFDRHSVAHPMVIRDRDRYLMWYGGADGLDATRDIRIERIGLASSTDGIHWTRLNGGQPVVEIGDDGEADSIQAIGATVVRAPEGGYTMWYGAYDGAHSIVAARSADGIQWTKMPVTGFGPGQALGPSAVYTGGAYYMQYSILVGGAWTLVAARSPDGIAWTPVNGGAPVLPPAPPGSFDFAMPGQNASVHPSQLLVEGRTIRAWYAGEDSVAPNHQRIGLMEATVPNHAGADFDADGLSDLLWQDVADGYVGLWRMDGRVMLESLALEPERVADTRWRIVGTGDANGDGKPDIFWQEQSEGWLAVWLMNGRQLIASELLSPSRVPDTRWKVVAIADMNRDNRPDLVWREESEGWVGVWLMHGLSATQSLALSPERVADADWVIAGAGDLNYDGQPDLLWQHRSQGWLAAWFMDGVSMTDSLLLTPRQVTDPQWHIVAISDTNGDGKADLIWREKTAGWLVTWPLHGLTATDSLDLLPNRVPLLNWVVAGPR